MLKFRANLLKSIRAFFDDEGHFEVETPLMSHDVVIDANLEPIEIEETRIQSASDSGALFLQTSPEFAMKRMLAAGAVAIYQITHAFRDEEWGNFHNPEFSMLEWYRIGISYFDQMNFVELLINNLVTKLGDRKNFEISQPFERLRYDDAFKKYAGTGILHLDCIDLKALAMEHDLKPPESLSNEEPDDWRNYLLAELVEPNLGKHIPTFLYDYPASQAALATVKKDEFPVAERFELYRNGLEICNGYQELTDVEELLRRQDEQNQLRVRQGKRELPTENFLSQAMQRGLPECSGVALGIDRLAMWLTGAQTIAEVIAFPFDRC